MQLKLLLTAHMQTLRKLRLHTAVAASLLLVALFSCSDELTEAIYPPHFSLNLTFQLQQENVTRANDYGFVTGDRMGIYVVDYNADGTAGPLTATDNRASNVVYTYDGDAYSWSSPTTIYWRDRQTPVSIYGYYPAQNYINDPTAWQFSIQTDQSTPAQNGTLSGYEQSDLLWGKVARAEYTEDQIVVRYNHILAGVRVHLIKGTGVSDIEWQKLDKIVLVDNTVTSATVDLSSGSVDCGSASDTQMPVRMAQQTGDDYRAVVIPQTVAAGKQLISITLDGQTYSHQLTAPMQYQGGKLHNFTLTVNKSELSGDYQITVTDDGISPWVNDETSHQFSAMAYVTVHCSEYGTLMQCLTNAGYDYKTIQNLKVTGEISESDFDLLRDQMPELHHLNLKEVTVKHICTEDGWLSHGSHDYDVFEDNIMGKLSGNQTIRSLILPTTLKRITGLSGMRLMYSTLEIPEGVTRIDEYALSYNDYNGVEMILPNTLDSICEGAFYACRYKCELKLSDNISYIGGGAFGNNYEDACDPNFYGVFHLPSKIKELVPGMFSGLGRTGNFVGTIELPQGIIETPDANWQGSWAPNLSNYFELILPSSMKRIGDLSFTQLKLSKLQLNEGLEEIGYGNFKYGSAPFPLYLPSTLRSIERECFSGNGFEGNLIIPEQCLYIAENCFQGNCFTSIQLPSRLENINRGCFANNGFLTSITLPKYVSYIGEEAFDGCDALQTVVCLNPEPPELGGAIFQGVYFDKCILQVPEASVETYRHTAGWNQFKNITAYHELAFNIPEILALDKGQTATGVIRSEGAWQVSECPDWVTVSPSSGTDEERKTELTITVKPMTSEGERSGRIVFKLNGKDYTTYTDVRQICSTDIKEDQEIVLQTASVGASRAIPLFIVGEGYSAEDVVSGQYMDDMRQQIDYLFSCEPYKTYRNYFTISTAIAVSPEHGINGRTRFASDDWQVTRDDLVWAYAKAHGAGITEERSGETTVVVLLNTSYLGNNTSVLSDNGRTISYLGKSTDSYPYSQREFVLREVGGVAFGHLGEEGISHFTFLKSCTCPNCNAMSRFQHAKSQGWYENISLTGRMNEVLWKDFIFDSRYAQYVDIFEGGYNHARGVFRSENMSIMGTTFIPYFNAISRMSIVKRIMQYAGETFTFEKFAEKDKREYPNEF